MEPKGETLKSPTCLQAGNRIGLPINIRVEDENGKLLRYREGSYSEKGQLTELRQYYNNSDYAENKLTYDNYGNISSVTDSRGAKLSYTYDSKEHMFVTGIE